MVFARSVESLGSAATTTICAVRLTVRSAAARRVFSVASTSSLRPSREGIMCAFPASSTLKSTSRAAQVVEVLLGVGAADPELALAVMRKLQEGGDLLGGDREVHPFVGEDHGTGERDAHLLRDRGERVPSNHRRRGLDRQGDRAFALERG